MLSIRKCSVQISRSKIVLHFRGTVALASSHGRRSSQKIGPGGEHNNYSVHTPDDRSEDEAGSDSGDNVDESVILAEDPLSSRRASCLHSSGRLSRIAWQGAGAVVMWPEW